MSDGSLLPSIISLIRFSVEQFPYFSWYPYWYLGIPFHYAIGPVVPVLFRIVSSVIPITAVYLICISFSVVITSLGVYVLLSYWHLPKYNAAAAAVSYLIFPVLYISLSYQNGLKFIAFLFITPIFLFYRQYLRTASKITAGILVLLLTLVMLTNLTTIITIVIGCTALILSEKKKQIGERVIESLILAGISMSIATVWYTPGYWFTILTNPSIGGIPVLNVIGNLIKTVLNLIPLVLAIYTVKLRHKTLSGYQKFAWIFSFSFIFLTLIRFIADPDFFMDWTGFLPELQIGLALLVGAHFDKLKRFKVILVLVALMVLLLNGYMVKNYLTIYQFNHVEDDYKTRISALIKKYVPKTERIFISGSSVFWINNETNVMQVRGSNDSVAIHPWWAHGAYQIREGSSTALTAAWLKIFGASYILVHDLNSQDPFQDFKNIRKYSDSKYFTLIDADKGDYLYKVKNSSLIRIADSKLSQNSVPRDGADMRAIITYANTLKLPVKQYSYTNNTLELQTNIKQHELVSLAVTYDSHWNLRNGEGVLAKDVFGNITIFPVKTGKQKFVLRYEKKPQDVIIPVLSIIVLTIMLAKVTVLYAFVQKRMVKLSIGLHEAEDEY